MVDPLAERIAELIADDWAPWCARARAESEALPDWKGSRGRATAERSVANPTIQDDPPQVGRAAAADPAPDAALSPLARRIIDALRVAGGAGMTPDDLARRVAHGKANAPMVALEVGNLRLAGKVGKVNGRLVMESTA